MHQLSRNAKLMIMNNSTLSDPEDSMLCKVIDRLCNV